MNGVWQILANSPWHTEETTYQWMTVLRFNGNELAVHDFIMVDDKLDTEDGKYFPLSIDGLKAAIAEFERRQ